MMPTQTNIDKMRVASIIIHFRVAVGELCVDKSATSKDSGGSRESN